MKTRVLIDPAEIGALGGHARAEKMTAKQRSESARNAVKARWAKAKKAAKKKSAKS